jgi:Plant transposon protein
MSPKDKRYESAQKAVRKDVERAFAALVALWHILKQPFRLTKRDEMANVMKACILMYNMNGVVSACPVNTSIGVLLFSLVDKESFRALCTMLTTPGHSSAYIFSSDSTARKARMTYLHADSIVPFDHGQFAVVK